jgi:hypothetical protein
VLRYPFSEEDIVAGKGMVMLRQGELRRLQISQKVLESVIKQVEAAEILSLSSKQIRRIIKRVRTGGNRGTIHQSRRKTSNWRIPDKIRDEVIQFYWSQHEDFGPTLASEKLLKRDRVRINSETLRRWLIGREIGKKTGKSGTSSVEGAEAPQMDCIQTPFAGKELMRKVRDVLDK